MPQSAMHQLVGEPADVKVKISKRTGKPVRKYEQKQKKDSVVVDSGEGTASFVGQVTAIIDKIAQDLRENVAQGVIGEHIPMDSDVTHMHLCQVEAPQDKGKGKRKIDDDPNDGTSAASGNKGGKGRRPASATPVLRNVGRALAGRVRTRKGVPDLGGSCP
ncbi:hypothetical protein KC19_VG067400 [Ceratodon purpureus]|uniref:Uncharacterized protein n=1 Tax=Ceratodon purpureus TaxID=3225 RepID=A0A8T0HMI2_CERPU|nr:hypothetical protein KC19_VG067400 [Ceratodon purpureus]